MDRKLRTAYFAGLIDGEGCIGIYRSGTTPIGTTRLSVTVKVNMTCPRTVQAIRDHFNVGTVVTRKVYGNGKPQWQWRVTHKQAREVLQQIAPYLITKQADLALAEAHIPKKRGRPRKDALKSATSAVAQGD